MFDFDEKRGSPRCISCTRLFGPCTCSSCFNYIDHTDGQFIRLSPETYHRVLEIPIVKEEGISNYHIIALLMQFC